MAQQSQQQNTDSGMAPVWITVLLFITVFLVWKTGHQYIVMFVFQINILQAKLVNLFIHSEQLTSLIYLMQTIDPNAVDWDQLVDTTRAVGDFMRYPVVLGLGVMAIVLYQSNLKLKYRKAHDMKSLRAQEQFNWPAIMPVVKEDLVSQDVNVGPWAMALTPMEFARKYHLLKKDDALLDNPVPGMEMTAGVRRGDAKRVFTLQLGPYWDGFEHCSPQAYALAGVFMARLNRDRDAANNILSVLDRTFVEGKPDFSVARPVVEKYKNTEEIQELIGKHAYTLTVLASLLEKARQDGVVPSSEFLWLKPVDRRLWYMLNCVGRQTPYAEVAGAFAHWRAEKEMGRRSLVPMIDEAIRALEVAVKEVKLSPRQMQELEP
ncbi:type IVB secretion system coupling complex protein DotM/IcmP [Legionella lytica]|uniref:Type IVB secretion system coupling complex protein DotM/IcmP n=1 Tax=Legionella lytica TaxID=96232 RepID=A0ABY4Y926_9GAMM|nr:type IVB secretion system coupling complex protein DotM/IcmP [Legionella lytica]USQ14133.1 type IVB secretion system coupling complex protein DotM/IcmP [Legionella lytica]